MGRGNGLAGVSTAAGASRRSATPKLYLLTLTLADGTTHTWTPEKLPKHWTSWCMRQMPSDTDFYGCSWGKEAVCD